MVEHCKWAIPPGDIGCLPKRVADEYNQLKRKRNVVSKARREETSKFVGIGSGDVRFRVCFSGFQSSFDPEFLQHAPPIPTFGNGNIRSVLIMLEVCNLHFDFFVG